MEFFEIKFDESFVGKVEMNHGGLQPIPTGKLPTVPGGKPGGSDKTTYGDRDDQQQNCPDSLAEWLKKHPNNSQPLRTDLMINQGKK